MKKPIIWITILAVLNIILVGCYSFQEVTQEELIEAKTEDNKHLDLRIVTKTGRTYQFNKDDYTIKEDSISGTGKNIIYSPITKPIYKDFTGSIYFGDIETISLDKSNVITTLLALGIIAGLIILIYNSDLTIL